MASAADNFDRANGAIGANWTQDSGSWVVRTNRAGQNTSGASYRKARYTATAPATANHYAESVVRATSTTGAGPIVRATVGAAVTYYTQMGFGDDAFYLLEVAAGVETILDTGAAMSAGVDYTLRITADGTAISGTVGGAADTSATDATLTALGWGIGSFGGSASGITLSWNDWAAADLAAASAAGPLVGAHLIHDGILQGRLAR